MFEEGNLSGSEEGTEPRRNLRQIGLTIQEAWEELASTWTCS